MSDVVFFDYWTRGTRHFKKLNESLIFSGFTTTLVHLGSTRGESTEPGQIIDGIKCSDINEYGGSLVGMLQTETPRVVVLLNDLTADKIIVRACRELNIKTVFIMHGIYSPQTDQKPNADLIDSGFGLKERMQRVPKYLSFIFQYIQAASLKSPTGFIDAEILLYFYRLGLSPGKTSMNYWIYRDSQPDLTLVYSDLDKELFVTHYKHNVENVKVVGNYNLDDLHGKWLAYLTERSEKSASLSLSKTFLYIESGLTNPDFQCGGWTEEKVIAELISINKIISRENHKLVVKLHPSSNYSDQMYDLTRIENIDIVLNCDLDQLLIESDVVLGQSSSVLMMALAIRKPVVLLSIAPLTILVNTYVNANVGVLINSVEEFEIYVNRMGNSYADPIGVIDNFRHKLVGLFDGQCSNRITSHIIDMM